MPSSAPDPHTPDLKPGTPPAALGPKPLPQLRFLYPGWYATVMGLSGLALAWLRAQELFGPAAVWVGQGLALLAALAMGLLLLASLLRLWWYPQAVQQDLQHPVRHVFFATLPISIMLLVSCALPFWGPSLGLQMVWLLGSLMQWSVTLWVLSRWLRVLPAGTPSGADFWPSMVPPLFIPVVGNVLAPLAGVPLGFEAWAVAQMGVGLVLWPVVLTLLVVRIATLGLWPGRLLPTTFISVAPATVLALDALQLGLPAGAAWLGWGVGLFFLLWSLTVFKRCFAEPFGLPFWGMSFPLAAFAALTLRLTATSAPWTQQLAVVLLAATTLLIVFLASSTVKGLWLGQLLVPEPVPVPVVPGSSAATAQQRP